MARPSRNNADYFSHSADFRNDRRIKAIRAQLGPAGYGLVLMLMEVLTDADFTQLDTSELELDLLAGDFGVSVTEIGRLLQLAERIGLFARNEAGFLICPDLNKSLEQVFEKRNRSRNAFLSAKGEVSVTETVISVTESTQSKVKEKEKKKISADTAGAETANASDLASTLEEPQYTLTHQIRLFAEKCIPGYSWGPKEATNAKELGKKLHNAFKANKGRDPADAEVLEYLGWLVSEAGKLEPYLRFQDIPTFNMRFNSIIGKIYAASQKQAPETKEAKQRPIPQQPIR